MSVLLESLRRRPVAIALASVLLLAVGATAWAHPKFRKARRPHMQDPSAINEFLFAPRGPAGDSLFIRLDTDGDGRLAPWELEWAAESLRSLDVNHDGWVGPAEVRHGAPPHRRPPPPPPFHPHR